MVQKKKKKNQLILKRSGGNYEHRRCSFSEAHRPQNWSHLSSLSVYCSHAQLAYCTRNSWTFQTSCWLSASMCCCFFLLNLHIATNPAVITMTVAAAETAGTTIWSVLVSTSTTSSMFPSPVFTSFMFPWVSPAEKHQLSAENLSDTKAAANLQVFVATDSAAIISADTSCYFCAYVFLPSAHIVHLISEHIVIQLTAHARAFLCISMLYVWHLFSMFCLSFCSTDVGQYYNFSILLYKLWLCNDSKEPALQQL